TERRAQHRPQASNQSGEWSSRPPGLPQLALPSLAGGSVHRAQSHIGILLNVVFSLVVGDLPVRSGHDRSAGFEEKFGFPAIPARHDMANPCSAIRLWRGFILSDSNPSRGQSLPWCTCASSIPDRKSTRLNSSHLV